MISIERRFHQEWLNLVQPAEGLVVSATVLEQAQCMERLPRSIQQTLLDLCDKEQETLTLRSLPAVLGELLDLPPELFDLGEALPEELSLYVPEGKQRLRPTMALRYLNGKPPAEGRVGAPDSTPAKKAGERYAMLVWETPAGLSLDENETATGPWLYPAELKFDRLLRECQVPIGLLSNGREIRLVYAPTHGASGWLAFRVKDMTESDGRAILDAFVMLLSGRRWFGTSPEHQLPALLRQSRVQQNDVTNDLADQVFEALEILLGGFQAASERDQDQRLAQALEADPDLVYSGLLTVLLRLVFLLYGEDHRLLPTDPLFAQHYSVRGLFDQLEKDHDRYPDTMGLRFGAYARLVSLFRLVWLGGAHGDFEMPERKGELFDPNEYPFLEGWGPGGSAPVASAEQRRNVRVPAVDDGTVYRVLKRSGACMSG
jgi:hypothetical protein